MCLSTLDIFIVQVNSIGIFIRRTERWYNSKQNKYLNSKDDDANIKENIQLLLVEVHLLKMYNGFYSPFSNVVFGFVFHFQWKLWNIRSVGRSIDMSPIYTIYIYKSSHILFIVHVNRICGPNVTKHSALVDSQTSVYTNNIIHIQSSVSFIII